jgi:hypothetical protein
MAMNLPTPRNPLPVTQASKKFLALYDNRNYITTFTGARLSAVKSIHSSPYLFKIHINIILTCNLGFHFVYIISLMPEDKFYAHKEIIQNLQVKQSVYRFGQALEDCRRLRIPDFKAIGM